MSDMVNEHYLKQFRALSRLSMSGEADKLAKMAQRFNMHKVDELSRVATSPAYTKMMRELERTAKTFDQLYASHHERMDKLLRLSASSQMQDALASAVRSNAWLELDKFSGAAMKLQQDVLKANSLNLDISRLVKAVQPLENSSFAKLAQILREQELGSLNIDMESVANDNGSLSIDDNGNIVLDGNVVTDEDGVSAEVLDKLCEFISSFTIHAWKDLASSRSMKEFYEKLARIQNSISFVLTVFGTVLAIYSTYVTITSADESSVQMDELSDQVSDVGERLDELTKAVLTSQEPTSYAYQVMEEIELLSEMEGAGEVIYSLPKGADVLLLSDGGNWVRVVYEDIGHNKTLIGWVLKDFLWQPE